MYPEAWLQALILVLRMKAVAAYKGRNHARSQSNYSDDASKIARDITDRSQQHN
jgi:hypothetical protein